MADQLQLRGGTTSEHSTFTGALREVTVDTDKDVLVVHDNSTAGGHPLMAEDGSNSALALGSAGTPSLKFTGDTNTGVFSPTADTVGVSTGGTERSRIDSSGRLLVGTTTAAGFSSSKMIISGAGTDVTGAGNLVLQIGQANGSVTSDEQIGNIIFGDESGYTYAAIQGQADLAAGSDSPGRLVFATTSDGGSSATERMRIDSSGRVGIGTTSITGFSDYTTVQLGSSSSGVAMRLVANGDTPGTDDFVIYKNTSGSYLRSYGDPLVFYGSSSEYGRWDTSGRLLIGTASSSTNAKLVLQGDATSISHAGYMSFVRDFTPTAAGTSLGFTDYKNTSGSIGAYLYAESDGAWTNGSSHPTRLVFSTAASGSNNPTERMRISQDGGIHFNTTTNAGTDPGVYLYGPSALGAVNICRDGGRLARLNRGVDDGDLVEFGGQGTIEGTISISGTTVSYNGAHLARWSQLPGGAERTEILRGSVLSNIDEMCDWGDEDNEQLNRMKVSDVEGDKNVAGVFQAWDDDDDTYTNDFYCAMTGDFVIRIAQGVTVERGDLLMSAGDGTAKPQDDDIIRSKTIAKVTSTHVSETYADGSYCVPCVLMAC